jgi:synaptobrevin homolog YKT6
MLSHRWPLADYNVHTYVRSDGLAGTIIADLEYPPRVAFTLLTQLLEGYATEVT